MTFAEGAARDGAAPPPHRESVASALVLDEVARREQLTVESGDLDAEIEKYAAATGRTGSIGTEKAEPGG